MCDRSCGSIVRPAAPRCAGQGPDFPRHMRAAVSIAAAGLMLTVTESERQDKAG